MAQRSIVSGFLDDILGTDSGSAGDARRAEERAARLRAALTALTVKQRFVLELAWGLRDGVEYSYREIAALMGVDRKTVYEHFHGGMNRLNVSVALDTPAVSPLSLNTSFSDLGGNCEGEERVWPAA
jgi:RNA polymerase sigma factor (sigma-70 family)